MERDVLYVIKYWMEGEINNFIKVWLSVYASLFYCYFAAKIIPNGLKTLSAFLPVVCLFVLLPLNLHSVTLGGFSSFLIAWLANFKILLFAFNKGPLADPSISLLRFVLIGCLPIEIKTNVGNSLTIVKGKKSLSRYAKKALVLALFFNVCGYRAHIHQHIILVVYCFIVYLCLELLLAVNAALARGILGVELESQFEEPFLSTSLQDFWGRRWNLMVTRILRPSIYHPIYTLSTKILGRKWGQLLALMATFIVSGIMHELIFFYLGRVMPTWEITCFFLLHGLSLSVEVAAKKALKGKIHVPRGMGTILTVAFVMVTGFWLFFPQLLRCKGDVRAFEEYIAVVGFCKDLGKALSSSTSLTSSSY